MMRYLLLFILSGLSAYVLGVYLPHWGLMVVVAFLGALVGGNGWAAFFSAALAVGAVWFFVPLMISLKTDSDLPEKMAGIMGFEDSLILFAVTAGMGFLLGGFGALTGNRFRKLFEKNKKYDYASVRYRGIRR